MRLVSSWSCPLAQWQRQRSLFSVRLLSVLDSFNSLSGILDLLSQGKPNFWILQNILLFLLLFSHKWIKCFEWEWMRMGCIQIYYAECRSKTSRSRKWKVNVGPGQARRIVNNKLGFLSFGMDHDHDHDAILYETCMDMGIIGWL